VSYEGLSNLHLMAKAGNYNSWMFRAVRPWVGERILEIGAGIGTVTEFLLDREHVTSTEMDEECLAELSRRFRGKPNVEVRHLDIARADGETAESLAGKGFDTVLGFNVLEHIPDDVQALKRIKQIAPKGTLLLVVPALPFLYGVEDRAVGHFRRYSKGETQEKLRAAGYHAEKIFYFNSLGAVFWFLKNRVLKTPPTTAGNIAVYDRYVVPVLSRVEGILPAPFGQSLVIVGRPLP